MGKLNNSVLILGEGPTEFFYLKSLADTFKHITIKPDILSTLISRNWSRRSRKVLIWVIAISSV